MAAANKSVFRLRHIFIGGVLFFLFFLSALPAWTIPWAIKKLQLNQIVINNPVGSLWNGTATGYVEVPVASAPAYPLKLDNIAWSWKPSRLLAGELAWDVTLQNPAAKFNGAVGLGLRGISISQAQVEANAQMMTDIYPIAALLKPQGKLQLTTDNFIISKNKFSGKAQLDWRGAEVVMSPVKPLGEYRALINATGDAGDVQLTTLTGALKLNGKGYWTGKDGARFSGAAQADPAQAANIDPLLQLMGKPAVNGAYPLDWPPK
jgi:general secretion pathway protein N